MGAEAATAALDAFLDLDHRMKDTVTAWQLRDDAEAQVLNDHADAAYDAPDPRPARRPARRRDRLARRRSRPAARGWPTTASGSVGRSSWRSPATSATWRHRASTATTASGSSSTRT